MSETTAIVPAPTGLISEEAIARIQTELDAALDPYIADKKKTYDEVAAIVAQLKVTDPASLKDADEWTKTLLNEQHGLEEVRKAGPGAFNRLGRRLGTKFKPLADVLDVALSNLKRERGAYLIAERNKQAESYQAAAVAHVEGRHEEAQNALVVANEAQTMAPRGTSVKEVWVVERYDPNLMVISTPTHPGLAPDEAAIKAYLAKLAPDDAPALPGVICKKVPHVTDRR